MAAILYFGTLYCFDVFLVYIFELLIPKNLGVDTKINILGAFLFFFKNVLVKKDIGKQKKMPGS